MVQEVYQPVVPEVIGTALFEDDYEGTQCELPRYVLLLPALSHELEKVPLCRL